MREYLFQYASTDKNKKKKTTVEVTNLRLWLKVPYLPWQVKSGPNGIDNKLIGVKNWEKLYPFIHVFEYVLWII